VDEFQNFSTDSFATIMSEARKYHLNLIVANQFTTQLTPEIRDAVFGNMGTIVSFRIGQNDVEAIAKYFQPTFDADDLLRVPNYNTIMRTLIGGVPTQPFSMATLPPLGSPNPKLAGALKQLSAAKYGRPRASVEKEIFERLATKQQEPPRPAFGQPAGAGGFGAPASSPFGAPPASGGFGANPSQSMGGSWQPPVAATPPPQPGPTGTGSFLDEWLTKRQTQPRRVGPTLAVASAPGAPAFATAPATGDIAVPRTQIDKPPQVTPATSRLEPSPATSERPAGAAVQTSANDVLAPSDAAVAQATSAGKVEGDTANISSSEQQQDEVGAIADALQESLKPAPDSGNSQIDDTAPLNGSDGPLDASGDKSPADHPPKEENKDTIFIDDEGTLHINNDESAK